MIIPRVFEPRPDEIIFHYCDAGSFHAICTNKTLRLSDLFTMNDFMEMHWGYSIWVKVANQVLEQVGKEFLDKVDLGISSVGLHGLVLSSSFSANGDVLSQWRAYADDGKGYAIGFNAQDMLELPIRPLKILYDEGEQIQELKQIILRIYEATNSGSLNDAEFTELCFRIAIDLAAYKNPAFAEEQEIRLIHVLNFEESNGSLKLVDNGGVAFGEEAKGRQVKFRMRNNIPVAYIEEELFEGDRPTPIKEIITGPKNDVLTTAISVFLETIGHGSVVVRKSKASYR